MVGISCQSFNAKYKRLCSNYVITKGKCLLLFVIENDIFKKGNVFYKIINITYFHVTNKSTT